MLVSKRKQAQAYDSLPQQDPSETIDLEMPDSKEHEQAPSAVTDEIKENVRASSKWIWLALLLGFCVSLFCLIQVGNTRKELGRSQRVVQRSPLVDAEECGDTQQQWALLAKWVARRGGWVHPGLSSAVFSDGVRGLRASRPIEANQTLFKMPESLFFNLKTVAAHPTLGPVYQQVPELHDGLGGLAVLLIHEALNKSSPWRPFLCTLPSRTSLPQFLSAKKRDRIYRELIGAEMSESFVQYVKTYNNETWSRYWRVVPALARHSAAMFPLQQYSMEHWAWAVGVIFSRSWSRPIEDPVLEKRTGKAKVAVHTLVPAMDMPNHNPRAKLPKFLSYKDRVVFSLTSHRAYKAGEQVFITYGEKCNDELLASYGFVPANNSKTKCKSLDHGNHTDPSTRRLPQPRLALPQPAEELPAAGTAARR